MHEEPEKGTKMHLALALAQGISIRAWARANNVPRVTAQRWSHDPEVRKAVVTCRRRVIDRAVGMLAGRSSWAAGRICKLAGGAESESVRLRALKSVLSDMMAVSKYSGLEERMAGLGAHVRAQRGESKARARTPSEKEFCSLF